MQDFWHGFRPIYLGSAIVTFPTEPPAQRLDSLEALQNGLVELAEIALGPRDVSKKIYQPRFGPGPPHVVNSINSDGACTELSYATEESWKEAVYELAHEAVHLLNPVAGATTLFEEGVAVAFALRVICESFGPTEELLHARHLVSSYQEAWELVKELEGDVFENGKKVRQRCGSLGKVTMETLIDLFPNHDQARLARLCEKFEPNGKAPRVV